MITHLAITRYVALAGMLTTTVVNAMSTVNAVIVVAATFTKPTLLSNRAGG